MVKYPITNPTKILKRFSFPNKSQQTSPTISQFFLLQLSSKKSTNKYKKENHHRSQKVKKWKKQKYKGGRRRSHGGHWVAFNSQSNYYTIYTEDISHFMGDEKPEDPIPNPKPETNPDPYQAQEPLSVAVPKETEKEAGKGMARAPNSLAPNPSWFTPKR